MGLVQRPRSARSFACLLETWLLNFRLAVIVLCETIIKPGSRCNGLFHYDLFLFDTQFFNDTLVVFSTFVGILIDQMVPLSNQLGTQVYTLGLARLLTFIVYLGSVSVSFTLDYKVLGIV